MPYPSPPLQQRYRNAEVLVTRHVVIIGDTSGTSRKLARMASYHQFDSVTVTVTVRDFGNFCERCKEDGHATCPSSFPPPLMLKVTEDRRGRPQNTPHLYRSVSQ